MIELVLAAVLMFRDPPGDAVGAGDLVPPSAEQYRNPGSFDLLEVRVLDTPMLAIEIEMGALPNPADLSNGFSNPVIDVYFELAEGGREALLPGPEMRMPPGRGWELAFRITGDGAIAHRSEDGLDGDPLVSYPVRVSAEDRVVRVETPFERTEILGVYAFTGVYDPFVPSGWRPVSETPSPWAFSSVDQERPVVDLLAPDSVTQAESIRSGVVPLVRTRTTGAMWILLMAMGVAVAFVGVVLRKMVTPESATKPVGDARDAEPPEPLEPLAPSEPSTPGEREAASVGRESAPTAPPLAVVIPTFLPALPPPRDAERPRPLVGAEGWGEGHESDRSMGWEDAAEEDVDAFSDALLVGDADAEAPAATDEEEKA